MIGSGYEYLMWHMYIAHLREAQQNRLAQIARSGERRQPGLLARLRLWLVRNVAARPKTGLGSPLSVKKQVTSGSRSRGSLIL